MICLSGAAVCGPAAQWSCEKGPHALLEKGRHIAGPVRFLLLQLGSLAEGQQTDFLSTRRSLPRVQEPHFANSHLQESNFPQVSPWLIGVNVQTNPCPERCLGDEWKADHVCAFKFLMNLPLPTAPSQHEQEPPQPLPASIVPVFVGALCVLSSTQWEIFLWIYWRNCLSDMIICLESCISHFAGAGVLSHTVYSYTAGAVPLNAL